MTQAIIRVRRGQSDNLDNDVNKYLTLKISIVNSLIEPNNQVTSEASAASMTSLTSMNQKKTTTP